jgi:antitoxin component YwqK of YwqJK toxin-antitoxin module
MKFKLILFIAFLCCNITFGQKPIEDISYFENGQINFKKNYILSEEITNLTCEAYYRNGKLASKSIISFDGTHTKYDYTTYFENGKLSIAGVGTDYDKGYNEIPEYIDNGFLLIEFSTPRPAVQEGKWVEYYDSDQLKYDGVFKDDKKIGEWITYFKNGQIESKGVYEEGDVEGEKKSEQKKGEWITYFENGKIESKRYYQ